MAASSSGCALLSTDPASQRRGGTKSVKKGKEAPMLAEKVKAGTRPPVEERLPKNPFVVEPAERIGQYGGTWRAGMLGPDTAWLDRSVGYDPVLRWRTEARTFGRDQVLPGVAELFEVNADATEYVFRFREGKPVGEGDRVVAKRNPYYWKVDPEGSQLPYVDEFVNTILTDPEVMLLKASNGEFDLQTRIITSLRNKPVLAWSREKGGYEFVDMANANMNTASSP